MSTTRGKWSAIKIYNKIQLRGCVVLREGFLQKLFRGLKSLSRSKTAKKWAQQMKSKSESPLQDRQYAIWACVFLSNGDIRDLSDHSMGSGSAWECGIFISSKAVVLRMEYWQWSQQIYGQESERSGKSNGALEISISIWWKQQCVPISPTHTTWDCLSWLNNQDPTSNIVWSAIQCGRKKNKVLIQH